MTIDSTPSSPPAMTSSNDRLWAVLCHLSYFFGAAILSFIFPLTVYLVARGDSPYMAENARAALNFHLSILLYIVCCVPLCFLLIGFPLIGALALTGIVCSIVAAIKAGKGVPYAYPITIHFVR